MQPPWSQPCCWQHAEVSLWFLDSERGPTADRPRVNGKESDGCVVPRQLPLGDWRWGIDISHLHSWEPCSNWAWILDRCHSLQSTHANPSGRPQPLPLHYSLPPPKRTFAETQDFFFLVWISETKWPCSVEHNL